MIKGGVMNDDEDSPKVFLKEDILAALTEENRLSEQEIKCILKHMKVIGVYKVY